MTGPYRILVTGSRTWTDEQELRFALLRVATPHLPSVVIVHGKCPAGADAMAGEWAADMGLGVEEHPADWDAPCRTTCATDHRRHRRDGTTSCPAAGNYRNQAMADTGPAICLAFFQPGAANLGTSDCVRRAVAAGIPVRSYGDVPAAIRKLLAGHGKQPLLSGGAP